MKQGEIESILDLHRKWLYGKEGGKRADLYGADLRGADLYGADLRGADLRGADLYGADLYGAKNAELVQAQTEIVPRQGEFVGWKKAYSVDDTSITCIVKLLIPKSAKRSNATGRKCRCSKAKVISIEGEDGKKLQEAYSARDMNFRYKVGETVEVKDFDDNRWNECAPGIHFFITKEEAEAWQL